MEPRGEELTDGDDEAVQHGPPEHEDTLRHNLIRSDSRGFGDLGTQGGFW